MDRGDDMRILLHTCCVNCLLFPVKTLKKAGFEVVSFFYNHNIHPYQEYRKRRESLLEAAPGLGLSTVCPERYDLERFLRGIAFKEKERCFYCYRSRLEETVQEAINGKFDLFSTTLLYSKFQKHDMVKEIAESLSRERGVEFYYEYFRKGWEEGVRESRQLGLYRQHYCGCIYSERERFLRTRQTD